MSAKITTATDAQWAEIEELKHRWIANTTQQHTDIHAVVERMYKRMDLSKPIVLVAPSPLAMAVWSAVVAELFKPNSQLRIQLGSQLYSQLGSQLRIQLGSQLYSQLGSQLYSQLDSQLRIQLGSQLYSQLGSQLGSQLYSQLYSQLDSQLRSQLYSQLDSQLYSQLDSQLYSQLDSQLGSQLDSQLYSQLYSQLGSQLRSQPWYVGTFWRAWSGWYLGGKILGVQFDQDALNLFTQWNECASVWCAYDKLCVVSANPIECHWLDGELHNESGPAVLYADNWSLWAINGVAVNEEIVMRPDSQSVETIRSEGNEEVKRIRIERYGWDRWIKAVKAKPVDSRRNDVDGTHEGLFALPDGMKTFVGRCRSTGRVYFLEVPPEIENCLQAQTWMLGGRVGNCVGAS